jgi:hypothetical protein
MLKNSRLMPRSAHIGVYLVHAVSCRWWTRKSYFPNIPRILCGTLFSIPNGRYRVITASRCSTAFQGSTISANVFITNVNTAAIFNRYKDMDLEIKYVVTAEITFKNSFMKKFQPINKREKAHEAVLKPIFYGISEDKVKTSPIPLHTRSLIKGQRNVKVTLSTVDDAGHTQSATEQEMCTL